MRTLGAWTGFTAVLVFCVALTAATSATHVTDLDVAVHMKKKHPKGYEGKQHKSKKPKAKKKNVRPKRKRKTTKQLRNLSQLLRKVLANQAHILKALRRSGGKRHKKRVNKIIRRIGKLSKRLKRVNQRIKIRRNVFRSVRSLLFRRSVETTFHAKCTPLSKRFLNIDGSCNHPRLYKRGAAGQTFHLIMGRTQSKVPTGQDRPSPRVISNIVHADLPKEKKNRRGMSEITVFFGQFLDHTVAEFKTPSKAKKADEFHIPIPPNDPAFPNDKRILLVRTEKRKTRKGWAALNMLPSTIDLAAAYGPNKQTSDALRTKKDGLMATTDDIRPNMLPHDDDGFFVAGDPRVNENPNLISFHTLFVRAHNYIAAEVKHFFPFYDDETIFQVARKINIGLQQSIVYYEFLPTVLGRTVPYRGPRKGAGQADPTCSDEFAVMAYRAGHTMVSEKMTFIRGNRNFVRMDLQDVFLKPSLMRTFSLEDCFRGMVSTRTAEVDVHVNDQLRNHLFAKSPGAIPLDLVSLNIQRGRDHRLPTYNQLRRKFGLRPVRNFRQITKVRYVQRALKRAYGHVNKIDGYAGGLAEDHCCGGSLGPLFRRIWINQFQRMRAGDRFYFEKRSFDQKHIKKIPTLNKLMNMKLQGGVLKFLIEKTTALKFHPRHNIWRTKR